MKNLDLYIINKLQDSYDRLWNTFGLTRGLLTAFFLSVIILPVVTQYLNEPTFWKTLLIAVFLLFIFIELREHEIQLKGKYQKLNINALSARSSTIQYIIRLPVFLAGLILKLSIGDFYGVFNNIAASVGLYMLTVMIKDRERKMYSREAWNAS